MRRAFGLLGTPVAHSVSPAIHRAAFDALGFDATYEAVEVGAEGLPEAVRAWAARGGGNVTLPHKERAAALLDRRFEAVIATGACNCFWGDGGGALAGDNTDVGGILAAAAELLGEDGLTGRRVLLLGAGGAARAALAACLRAGAAAVHVRNRTIGRARRMVAEVAPEGAAVEILEAGRAIEPGYDLAINATSLGLEPDDPPPPGAAACAGAALDLVYAAGETRWVRDARAEGIPALDGLSALVGQAALSLRRWFPGVEPPLAAMRRAAERSLGR